MKGVVSLNYVRGMFGIDMGDIGNWGLGVGG
jgi:hypothetical protein